MLDANPDPGQGLLDPHRAPTYLPFYDNFPARLPGSRKRPTEAALRVMRLETAPRGWEQHPLSPIPYSRGEVAWKAPRDRRTPPECAGRAGRSNGRAGLATAAA